MHRDGEWPPGTAPGDGADGRSAGGDAPDGSGLRSVAAAPAPERALPPGVRLRREYKGPTVRDLLADQGLDEVLPGQVRSALAHLERGDVAAAEAAMPGHFAAVLPGPGRRAADRRRRQVGWITAAVLATALVTATIWWL
ncbi:MAG: hypothetical protein AB7O97_23660 [Planctomycetota bacterium]